MQGAIAYVLDHGLADLSLRPLAAAVGTSARMLIYYFGSKEGLLTEVLEAMQAHLRRSFSELTAGLERTGEESGIRVFWSWATSGESFAYLRRFYELQILASQNPAAYARYLERSHLSWLEQVGDVLPPAERTPARITLIIAVFDGLFLELMSTGDGERTTEALDDFVRIARRARSGGAQA